jgi:hypothetical protein
MMSALQAGLTRGRRDAADLIPPTDGAEPDDAAGERGDQ